MGVEMKKNNRHKIAYRFILPYAAATLFFDGGLALLALKFLSVIGYVMLAYELAGVGDRSIAAAAASSNDFIAGMILVYILSIGFQGQSTNAHPAMPSMIVRELN